MPAPLSARASSRTGERANNAAAAGAMHLITGHPTNPLLAKDDVGLAKPSCYDLPESNFTYGRPGNHDAEGAREVSMHWAGHKPSRAQEGGADFVWFNKRAATAKVTTPKQLSMFKKEHECLAPSNSPRRPGARRPADPGAPGVPTPRIRATIPSDIVEGFTYGRPVRPSTPIDEVISYRFAEAAEKELAGFYSDFREEQLRSATQVRKIPLTTASRGHASTAKKAIRQEEVVGKDLFKIRRFQSVGAKVSTTRAKKPSYEDVLVQEGPRRREPEEFEEGMADIQPMGAE